MSEATPVFGDAVFLESPRWRDETLWVSDVLAGTVLALTPGGTPAVVARVAGLPSGLGHLPDGRTVVVSLLRRQLLEVSAAGERLYADLGGVLRGTPNDMVIDAAGRAFVGDLGFDLLGRRTPRAGGIVCVLPDGRARVVADELDYPNGIAVSADGRMLFVAESEAGALSVFAVSADGALADRTRLGDFGTGSPDGICLDASGAIWVSLFAGGEFVRVSREGHVLDRVAAAGPRAVACVLGGPTRDTLYCLSAQTTEVDLRKGRSTARIDAVAAPCAGAGFP